MNTRTTLPVALLALLLAGAASAFDAVARIRTLDPEKRTAVLRGPAGQEHAVTIAVDARILDREGKPLTDGLKSKELKEGAQITVTVEQEGGEPVVHAIWLGVGPGTPIVTTPRFDSSRLKPLTELGTAQYRGFPGGLYPGGRNDRPAAHEAAGIALSRKVQPLDAEGKPAPNGRIVLLTVGMSNTAQASQAFVQLAQADPEKNPRVLIVNGAQGGMTAARIQNLNDPAGGQLYWKTVDDRLKAAGVTRAQVQAAWIKEADAGPTQGFPAYAKSLQGELARIVQLLPERFPNLKLAYLSSRTYGGYAKSPLNPEPYAYESAFSVKWVIEQQLQGDSTLSYDPAKGPAKAPWLSWGPYLWANGSTKRADGFSYEEADFAGDGTHESPSGQRKVGGLLLQFFKTDPTTRGWFTGKG